MRTEPFPDDVFDLLLVDERAAFRKLAEAISAHADASRNLDLAAIEYEAIHREAQLQHGLRDVQARMNERRSRYPPIVPRGLVKMEFV